MCGIIVAVSSTNIVKDVLLNGLSDLEYRGYDSAGICTICKETNSYNLKKTVGKVINLKNSILNSECLGSIGIAHTRWSTHGEPNEINAHPHICGNLAIVHNGIIENYLEIKEKLKEQGYSFLSTTDTEVLLCLIHHNLQILQKKSNNTDKSSLLQKAIKYSTSVIKGSYGLALLDLNTPDTIYAIRSGSPLIIGCGIDNNYISSDIISLLPHTNKFIYLKENHLAIIKSNEITIINEQDEIIENNIVEADENYEMLTKKNFKHYMIKEIFDQPTCFQNSLKSLMNDIADFPIENIISSPLKQYTRNDIKKVFHNIQHVQIVACGTSFHSSLVAKYYFDENLSIQTNVDIASEYRYKKTNVKQNSLFITISQSGETADSIASLRLAKTQGFQNTLCLCNVSSSTLVRESDFTILLNAGVEVGVASTKAFTSQILNLLILMLTIGLCKEEISPQKLNKYLSILKQLPTKSEEFLQINSKMQSLANDISKYQNCLFIGRGFLYTIALEGALKLKEISYIHAEGYAAGELKHGPIALIDKNMPVIVLAPDNFLFEKIMANMEEISARGGQLFIFTSQNNKLLRNFSTNNKTIIELPSCEFELQPILYSIPLQLLAYHCAVSLHKDVDKPRNLAKSVTVE